MKSLFNLLFALVALQSCIVKETDTKKEEHVDLTPSKDSMLIILNELSIQNPDSCIRLSEYYLTVDSLSNDSLFYYLVNDNIGKCQFYIGNPHKGLQLSKKSLDFLKKIDNPSTKVKYLKGLYNYAYMLMEIGDLTNSLNYFDKAINLADKLNNPQVLVNSCLLKSHLYNREGSYAKALESIERGILECHQRQDSVLMISCLQEYADIFVNCHLFEEADEQYKEVLKYKKHFTSFSHWVHYLNKGRMFYLQKNYLGAKQEFLTALDFVNELDVFSKFINTMNLMETYMLLNQLDSASIFMENLDRNKTILQNAPQYAFNYYSLAGNYYQRIDKPQMTNTFFSKADSISKKFPIDIVLSKLHKKRKMYFYQELGQYDKALNELQEYNELDKKSTDEINTRKVASLKYRFQRDTTLIAQRALIQQNEQELESYRIRQIVLAILIILIIGLALFVLLFFRKKQQLRSERDLQKITKLRIQNARNSMSPHFFFNILGSFNHLLGQPEVLKTKLGQLSILLRKVIENINKTVIPLGQELEAVKAYISLQQGAVPGSFEVSYDINENINLDCNVPAMIMQIPVENAIKHGLLPKADNRNLYISIQKNDGFVGFMIKDNGIGINNSIPTTRGTGTGIKVLHNTINILNQYNDGKISFELSNIENVKETGTMVTFNIPVPLHYKEMTKTN